MDYRHYVVWVMNNGDIFSRYFRRRGQAMKRLEELRSDPSCIMSNAQFHDEDGLILVRDYHKAKDALTKAIVKDMKIYDQSPS